MIVQVDEILKDVRVCMDRNRVDEALLDDADADTLTLDELIKSKVEEGIDMVHREAPYHMLEQGHTFGDAIHWGELESGWILLPDDYMRLVVFEMSDWEKAVYEVMSVADARYAQMRSRVKALRGTAQRPVCVLGVRPEGRVLEFYSCKSESATVRRGIYTPYTRIDDDGGADISELCYESAVYRIAGLALASLGEEQLSKVMEEESKKCLL